ncbi:hypothetical protein E4T39_03985 [Aureobasidium subglaciale]|nr:hypothetical protein E4T39_03985 [Aureobasidium subglaciale]
MEADLRMTEYDGQSARQTACTNMNGQLSKPFPPTEDLELGQIIAKAWQRQYSSISELRDAILTHDSPQVELPFHSPVLMICALACVAGLAIHLSRRR